MHRFRYARLRSIGTSATSCDRPVVSKCTLCAAAEGREREEQRKRGKLGIIWNHVLQRVGCKGHGGVARDSPKHGGCAWDLTESADVHDTHTEMSTWYGMLRALRWRMTSTTKTAMNIYSRRRAHHILENYQPVWGIGLHDGQPPAFTTVSLLPLGGARPALDFPSNTSAQLKGWPGPGSQQTNVGEITPASKMAVFCLRQTCLLKLRQMCTGGAPTDNCPFPPRSPNGRKLKLHTQ